MGTYTCSRLSLIVIIEFVDGVSAIYRFGLTLKEHRINRFHKLRIQLIS